MKSIRTLLLALLFCSATAFTTLSGVGGGSAFIASQRPQPQHNTSPSPRSPKSQLYMGGKSAKFGVFSPAVYGAVAVLGRQRLNKYRAKAITLHSQAIGDFCEWAGAYHLRTRLIKKAKTNGDILGFLV